MNSKLMSLRQLPQIQQQQLLPRQLNKVRPIKIMKSLILSSLLALALATAHGATIQPADSNRTVAAFQKSFEETDAQPVTILLHENNDEAKVTIPNGALVKVVLESNPASTGFDWSPTFSSSDVLTFQSKNIRKGPSHLVGGAVDEIWIFKATTPGQTLLTFSLARSW
ncbi:MAG: protease inhibitor I42 family protein, partial [Verrucomicrobia bacterium]|nr:protease inhibitor I42 family protein [Verrucomicrobiota bacterium]